MKYLNIFKENIKVTDKNLLDLVLSFAAKDDPKKFKLIFDKFGKGFDYQDRIIFRKIIQHENYHFFDEFESSYFDSFTEIYLKEVDMESFNFFKKFKNLEILKITHSTFSDSTNIDHLNKLKYLSIAFCDVEELNLNNFPKLESLNLVHNELISLNFENFFPLLRRIDASYNEIKTINGIENLPEVVNLFLHENNLTDLSFFTDPILMFPSKIKRLKIYNNDISDLTPLTVCTSVEYLKCSGNNIQNLIGLRNMKNLKDLDCYNNELDTLEELKVLRNLKTLDCSSNYLEDFKIIEFLESLEDFTCDNNPGYKEIEELDDKYDGEELIFTMKEFYGIGVTKNLGSK